MSDSVKFNKPKAESKHKEKPKRGASLKFLNLYRLAILQVFSDDPISFWRGPYRETTYKRLKRSYKNPCSYGLKRTNDLLLFNLQIIEIGLVWMRSMPWFDVRRLKTSVPRQHVRMWKTLQMKSVPCLLYEEKNEKATCCTPVLWEESQLCTRFGVQKRTGS